MFKIKKEALVCKASQGKSDVMESTHYSGWFLVPVPIGYAYRRIIIWESSSASHQHSRRVPTLRLQICINHVGAREALYLFEGSFHQVPELLCVFEVIEA